jgi:glutaredoxin
LGDGAGPWTLRYFAPATGELVAVKTAAEVPEGARGQVLVAPDDPALQGPWLFVADLSRKEGDRFVVRTVDRGELEKNVAQARPATAAPTGPAPTAAAVAPATPGAGQGPGEVVIFRTAWCGYCKKTAEYLKLKGVPFVEKDIEADPGARADMVARARKAGVPPEQLQGVPIISIRGRIINGFNREAIDAALRG